MNKKWKMINGYDNYAISNFGDVRNLNTGKLLKHQYRKSSGHYPFIDLRGGKKGRWCVSVHCLVAQVFIGLRPDNLIIHHKDTDLKNLRVGNLEYLTIEQHKEVHRELSL